PTGEQFLLVRSVVAGPENITTLFFSRAMFCTARATAELVRSAIAVTPSRSNHSRARAAPTSALFWLSAETRSIDMPLHSAFRQSSMASCAAATEPMPPMDAYVPDMSVSTPILTGGVAACETDIDIAAAHNTAARVGVNFCMVLSPLSL